MKTSGSPCLDTEDSWPWAVWQALFNAAWVILLLWPISFVLVALGGLVLAVVGLAGIGAARMGFDLWVFVSCRKEEDREWPPWVINVEGPVAESTVRATIFVNLGWAVASLVFDKASDLVFYVATGALWVAAVGYVILVALHGTKARQLEK